MLITYRDFPNLKFPLYQLPDYNWIYSDGLLTINGLIIDDKKMPGKTLGVRRLQCNRADELLKLKKAILDIPTLLSCKRPTFIDSNGKPFIYQKTKMCKVKTFKIKKIEKKEVASLLWLHDLNNPITIPRPPSENVEWARMLLLDSSPWLLFDYVKEFIPITYKKV